MVYLFIFIIHVFTETQIKCTIHGQYYQHYPHNNEMLGSHYYIYKECIHWFYSERCVIHSIRILNILYVQNTHRYKCIGQVRTSVVGMLCSYSRCEWDYRIKKLRGTDLEKPFIKIMSTMKSRTALSNLINHWSSLLLLYTNLLALRSSLKYWY